MSSVIGAVAPNTIISGGAGAARALQPSPLRLWWVPVCRPAA